MDMRTHEPLRCASESEVGQLNESYAGPSSCFAKAYEYVAGQDLRSPKWPFLRKAVGCQLREERLLSA